MDFVTPNPGATLPKRGCIISFSRPICFDKRDTGLSGRSVGMPHLEQRTDDIRVALDAAGSRWAAHQGRRHLGDCRAHRIAQQAQADEGLASGTVRDLVAGAALAFADLGTAELKGLHEPMRLFSAVA